MQVVLSVSALWITRPAAIGAAGKTKSGEPNMTTNNRPSHTVSIVEGEGDNSVWTEIGAMWPHKDGKGFQLNQVGS